jgi:hypothetical protein
MTKNGELESKHSFHRSDAAACDHCGRLSHEGSPVAPEHVNSLLHESNRTAGARTEERRLAEIEGFDQPMSSAMMKRMFGLRPFERF